MRTCICACERIDQKYSVCAREFYFKRNYAAMFKIKILAFKQDAMTHPVADSQEVTVTLTARLQLQRR